MSQAISYVVFCKRNELNAQLKSSKDNYQKYCSSIELFYGAHTDDKAASVIKKAQTDWGGKRSGAGRKAEKGKTIVKRVPDKYWDTLNEIIDFLDEKEEKYSLEHIKETIMTVLRNNY